MWIRPALQFRGTPRLPGDKSISHRYALLAALCPEETRISNYSASEDCQNTLRCLQAVGVRVENSSGDVRLQGRALGDLGPADKPLDCGNSGTTIRLLSGILAAQKFHYVLTGDDSLRSRPMGRILLPLRKMGATILASHGERAPLQILGRPLHGVEYILPVASAQVKSCVLLAGLHARGRTEVIEAIPTRSHTERAFPLFGVDIEIQEERISVRGGQQPRSPGDLRVPADPSAAAFFCVAACLIPGSSVTLNRINFNPARIELFRILIQAGADIRIESKREEFGEPVADIVVRYSDRFLQTFPEKIGGKIIPALIDEIPILAVLACRLPHGLEIRDAAELRHKETDRIHALAEGLKTLGVRLDELEDGLRIHPCSNLHGARVASCGDHRLAMAFSIAALLADSDVEIRQSQCVAVSYPDFYSNLEKLTGAGRPA
ncbi:MAG TPA: 3-phosphoshikimate 1-carboxyvinyltransferase [Acidobacteriota bacterium]|jgi:3-phosphoshikimate 1-carboxyvinyltransferase|nr:3-phosphoshikimate 1-carboxyvinyltransferase [Acidobacteriota bacterium]